MLLVHKRDNSNSSVGIHISKPSTQNFVGEGRPRENVDRSEEKSHMATGVASTAPQDLPMVCRVPDHTMRSFQCCGSLKTISGSPAATNHQGDICHTVPWSCTGIGPARTSSLRKILERTLNNVQAPRSTLNYVQAPSPPEPQASGQGAPDCKSAREVPELQVPAQGS